jgi:hypothetical protein
MLPAQSLTLKWGPVTARAVLAGAAYAGIVFAGGFVLGTIRVLALSPRLGELPAVQLELPIMLALSWTTCRRITRRFAVPDDREARWIMDGTGFALLMGAEMATSLFVFGRSISEHLATYASPAAAAGLAGQLLFAMFPILQRHGAQRLRSR